MPIFEPEDFDQLTPEELEKYKLEAALKKSRLNAIKLKELAELEKIWNQNPSDV